MDIKQLEAKVFALEKRLAAVEKKADTVETDIDKVRREVANEVEGPLMRRIEALEQRMAAQSVKDDIVAKVNKITQDIAAMKK